MRSALILAVIAFSSATIVSTSEVSTQHEEFCKIPLEKKPKDSCHSSKENGVEVSINLQNNHNWAYAGVIKIGNPPQKLRIEFDTGSADLSVISSEMCKKDPSSCKGHFSYNHTASPTYVEDGRLVELSYGTGVSKGFISQDDVVINGVKIEGQTFLEVTSKKVSYNSVKYPEEKDGILGLGFPILSLVHKTTGKPTPLCYLVSQGLLKRPIFSFYFNKVDPVSTEAEQNTGEIVLGGINPDHFTGEITYAPINEGASNWVIRVDWIKVNEDEIAENILVMLDSGTSGIVGPEHLVGPIRRAVFGNDYKAKKTDNIDCSIINSGSLPDVIFIIKGTKFVLTPEDYIVKEYSEDMCLCGFSESATPGLILGNVFMRKVYTVFDIEKMQIGFAQAK